MVSEGISGKSLIDQQAPRTSKLTRQQKKNLALASLGSILEYYEFMIFGFLAVVIARLFFPPSMPDSVRTFQTFVIFSLGLFLRPLSGVIVGHLGDKFGRKRLFLFTVVAMAVPTTLMGLTPTYAQIGIAAPIILLILRMAQGIAIAGEFAGSSVFIAEHVPGSRVASALGWMVGASYLGFFLGAAMGATLSNALDPASLDLWGWRVAFLVGGVFGLIAVFLRRSLDETPLFQEIMHIKTASRASPIMVLLAHHLRPTLFVTGASIYLGILFWLVYLYMPTFLQTQYGFERSTIFNANAAALLLLSVMCVVWGRFADKVGLAWVLAIGAIGSALTASLFFWNIDAIVSNPNTLIWWYLSFSVFGGTIVIVMVLAALAFPTEVRFTGVGLSFNLGIVISSVTPAALAWLVSAGVKSSLLYVAAGNGVFGVVLAMIAFRIRLYPGSR